MVDAHGGDGTDRFEAISAMDSKSLLKPHVPLLIVTDSEATGTNVMTAAWWMLAGYEPFRYLLSVDHEAFTYEVIEANPAFVMAVPTTDMVDAVALCGSTSGRDVDKIEALGLDVVPATALDVPLLAAALGNVECRVVDAFETEHNTYYFGEVATAHARPNALDGRILDPSARPLAYMGSDWGEGGETKYRFSLRYERELERFPDGEVLADRPDRTDDG